jgi:8-oxo-dGTP pyrophosphatase MutT (NUDIX family)
MYTQSPLTAQFDSARFLVGGGVAIFHLATGRVVLCSYESQGRKVYFLPKGRRDAGEESGIGAEREGYEEVGEGLFGIS